MKDFENYRTWYTCRHMFYDEHSMFLYYMVLQIMLYVEVTKKKNSTVNVYKRVHFLEDGKPKYTCEICGKSYIRSWSYYGHMREHASGEKQHKCDVCGKIFNYASNLRQHMLIHTGTAT